MKSILRRRNHWVALVLVLAGCNGGGTVKPAQPPVIGLNPTIIGAQGEARLIVRIDVAGLTQGLRTQAIPPTFDHASATLSGSLLNTPRTLTVPAASFSPATGVVTTLAGGSVAGYLEGTGTAARFEGAYGIVEGTDGNFYVADLYNNRIRKITPAGVVTTFAGSGAAGYLDSTGTAAQLNHPRDLAVDSSGYNFYFTDSGNGRIRKVTSTGVVTTLAGSGTAGSADGTGTAAQFWSPQGIAVGSDGNIYVCDQANHRIRKITPAGVVTTFAGGGGTGAQGGAGYADGTGTAALFNQPEGIAADGSGNLYVAEWSNHRIRKITPVGVVTTLAGSGVAGFADGTGTAAQFKNPTGVVLDSSGNIYVADRGNNRIRKMTPNNAVTTLAGSGVAGYADGTGTAAQFNGPVDVTLSSSGNLYVAEYSRVRKITFSSTTTSGVFTNLRPGDGYKLAVSLYDNASPSNHVLADGETPAAFSLIAGTNQINVTLNLTSAITTPLPLPLTFSDLFGNSTANAYGYALSTVVVSGDTLKILPGVVDPNSQLSHVQLWLDGTAGANFLDGKLLATWYPDGFGTPFEWTTGTTLTPVVIGTAPSPPPSPTPNPFVSPTPTPTPVPTPPPVSPPSTTPAESTTTANHTLTFVLYSRLAPAGDNLIGMATYNLTVLPPASINVGLQ